MYEKISQTQYVVNYRQVKKKNVSPKCHHPHGFATESMLRITKVSHTWVTLRFLQSKKHFQFNKWQINRCNKITKYKAKSCLTMEFKITTKLRFIIHIRRHRSMASYQ